MSVVHPLTWQQAGQSDDGLQGFLVPALVDLGASIIIQDDRHNYLYLANLPDAWAAKEIVEPTDARLFGEDVAARLSALKATLTESGHRGQLEVALGSDQVYEFRVQSVAVASKGLYLVTTIIDRSEERHRERLLRALLREVSHRSKNLLAIIQSIALQTARYSASLDLFLHKFRGRLYSLSQSQDLITDSSWRGAYFYELVHQQTGRYLPENKHMVKVSGENVLLTPNASLHLGLALHELIVNAVSHGSLLKTVRPIEVTCLRLRVDGHDCLQMSWDEALIESSGAENADDSLKAHFGSTVLERVVPASVNGKARYVISNEQISYQLHFPMEAGAE